MSELNKDGLPIGQPVDFETVKRIENQRRLKEVEEDAKQKRRRKKASEAE